MAGVAGCQEKVKEDLKFIKQGLTVKKNNDFENDLKLFNAKKNYELANENIVRT
jgi:hypothetical protein